jgi:phage gp36-like protein
MSWSGITPESLATRLSQAELEALGTQQLDVWQADPVQEILTQVTDEIRGYIAVNAFNRVGPADTLPTQLHSAALAIARYRLLGRLAAGKSADDLGGEFRQRDYDDAIRLLRDVAKGDYAVEQPATEGPEDISAGSPNWGSETKTDL